MNTLKMKRKTCEEKGTGQKRGPNPEGGGAPLSKVCEIVDFKSLKNTFLTSLSVTMAPILPDPLFFVKRYRVFRAGFPCFSGKKMKRVRRLR
jgi:hypothetical protein